MEAQKVQVCTPDEVVCDGACVTLNTDPTNCGVCGNTCKTGTVCYVGSCTTSCGPGTIQCGQSCVAPDVDRNNCGGCGKECGTSEVCVNAACGSTCANEQTLCVLDGGAAYCANTSSDNKNCGSCGSECSAQLVCSNGTCSSTCSTSQTFCTGDAGAYCANLQSDNDNCGACGSGCSSLDSCISGACTSACSSNQAACPGPPPHCADLSSDVNDCGKCGVSCSANAYCLGGECDCQTGYSTCNGSCVDLTSDDANCGSCGTQCAGTCTSGRCVATVLTDKYGIYAIALDSSNIYWSDGSQVQQVAKGGGTPIVLGTASLQTDALAIDSKNVYWYAGSTTIVGAPIGGGTTFTVALDTPFDSLCSDGTNLYYFSHQTNQTTSTLVSVPVSGGTPTALSGTDGRYIARNGGWLYWIGDYGDVDRILTWGASPSTLGTVLESLLDQLAVDNSYVYITDHSNGRIVALNDTGTVQPPVVLTSGLNSPSVIQTDSVSLYFFDYPNGGRLSKLPVGGGTPTTLATSQFVNTTPPLAVDSDSVYYGEFTSIKRVTPK